MSDDELEETRRFWNDIAHDWDIQVGAEGDDNRRLNSDPVLWRMVGDVAGLAVLDAGCGTGYLSRKLHDSGARVVGIDFSERMIAIARGIAPYIDFRVESVSRLASIASESIDLVVSNYVLMDTPLLHDTLQAFHRVLKPLGTAVTVFSHPCFPQGRADTLEQGRGVRYSWESSYFEQRKCSDPPWGHFSSSFIWFHRPLSDYWKAFTASGLDVVEFEEPHVSAERQALAKDRSIQSGFLERPYSVAFKLRRRAEGSARKPL